MLGAEYLGLNGLFSNILSVLSLTELGVSSAIMYNLYKPIVDDDKIYITKLINFYRQLYHIIGCAVLALGLLVTPFLKYIVNFKDTVVPNETVYYYYLLLLLNTVTSYFFVYKTAILIADQKSYHLKYFNICFTFIQLGLQIFVLLKFKSYIGYILVQVLCSFIQNILTSQYSQHKYQFIKNKSYLNKSEKKDILKQVGFMFSYQLGNVILNNTDNILISMFDSTKMVGLYSNYYSLVSAISSFTSLVFTSIQASVGNYLVRSNSNKQHLMFKTLTFLSFCVYSIASVCIFEFIDDVVMIWFNRSDYILSKQLVLVCIFNFYITGILFPIWSYRNTIGLFKQTKNVMFYASVINLVLSIILGKIFGILGVLIATGISRIVTTIWYEPYVLFKSFFKTNKRKLFFYYAKQVLYALELIFVLFVSDYIIKSIMFDSTIISYIFKLFISLFIPSVVILFHFKSEEFKELLKYAKRIILKIKRQVL